MRSRLLATAVALLVAVLPAPAGADPLPSPTAAQLARLEAAPLPARDPFDLAVRLRGLPADTPTAAAPVAEPLNVGHQGAFWIVDQRAARMLRAHATLLVVTDHAYWYVQDEYADRVPREALEQAAHTFEAHTYPIVRRYFGPEPSPGVDGDPRIVFFLGYVPGVAAYFSGVDAYPRAANARSNEREIIYVNLDALRPGGAAFDSTMAHEFQHMVEFGSCARQETWVSEGSAELASRVAGYRSGRPLQFMTRPDVQLTAWTDEPGEFARHYQAAYLFLRYVSERFGGPEALPEVLGYACLRGPDLFASYLERAGIDGGFAGLFADWAVANLLDDPGVADGRYGYPHDEVQVNSTATLAPAGSVQRAVPQFAAHYVELPSGAGTVRFDGSTEVSLLPLTAPSGQSVWWSNRADSLDSRLTRRLDLRGLSGPATLHFRAWYDIESDFDFAYLLVSQDEGRTWQTLAGQNTTPDDELGNNFGSGWTGVSGGGETPVWVDESVDLSPFVGAEILLRFEYVTDQGYNANGFAFDDLHVPALGLLDDGETAGDWTAEGWLRVDAPLPQTWALRHVRWVGDTVHVEEVPVSADGNATVPLDPAATRSVLVVAPTAPRTLQPARYRAAVHAAESAHRAGNQISPPASRFTAV